MCRNRILVCALLAVLAALPFVRGIQFGFVYDDHGVIVENEYLEHPENLLPTLTLKTLLNPRVVDSARPAVIATYFMDRALSGLNPVGYHITNILLHAFATVLLFLFARNLIAHEASAFCCALLFAWHPLALEVVQSPAFREDTLSVAFGVLFLMAALRSRNSALWFVIALPAYAIALLSKESAAVFPLILFALWWLYPAMRPGVARLTAFAVLSVAMTAAYGAVLFLIQPLQQVGVAWNGVSLRGAECIWSAPWLLAWNLRKLAWPHPLSVDYIFDPVAGPLDARFAVSCVALIAAAFAVWRIRGPRPLAAFAALWIVATFLPVSNLLPLFNPVADRYAYAMIPGFILLLICIVKKLRCNVQLMTAALASVYFALIMLRIGDWESDRKLWMAVLDVEPRSARAYTWLGLELKHDGNVAAAWESFTTAELLNPHDPSPSVNKAVLSGERGDLENAELRLRAVLEKHPDSTFARKNLATCLRLQGRDAEAAKFDLP